MNLPRALALLICCVAALPAFAFDYQEPAQLRVSVKDGAGRPLPDAEVTVRRSAIYSYGRTVAENKELIGAGVPGPLQKRTSREGEISLLLSHPDGKAADGVRWGLAVHIERRDFWPADFYTELVVGAVVERQITVERSMSTTLRLRDDKGRPLTGISFGIHSYLAPLEGHTDQRGEFRFAHRPLGSAPYLFSGRVRRTFTDGSVVTLAFTAEEQQGMMRDQAIEGRLLTADGQPAAGWFIAGNLLDHGPRHIMMGNDMLRPEHEHYSAGRVTPVGSDGRFSLNSAGGRLAAISPSGISFMYNLNTGAWPPGVRRLTLRIPPVRRMHRGQAGFGNLHFPDYRPGAGLHLIEAGAAAAGERWSLFKQYMASGHAVKEPLQEIELPGGRRIGSIITDAQGRYELPVYFGVRHEFSLAEREHFVSGDLSSQSETGISTWGSGEFGRKLKRLTIRLYEQNGRPIPEPAPELTLMYKVGSSMSGGASACRGPAGRFFYVPAAADSLELKVGAGKWGRFTKAVTANGEEDSTIEVTLPETSQWLPLRGKVLDPKGRPVEGAVLSLQEPYGNVMGIVYATPTYYATSLADGSFTFEAAPDAGELRVFYPSRQGEGRLLPGYIDPIAVTRENRNLTLRLQAGGAVRLLLPKAADDRWEQFHMSGGPPAAPSHSYYFPDQTRHHDSVVARFVRPGDYVLYPAPGPAGKRKDAGAGEIHFTVKAGRETVVDLRRQPLPVPLPPLELFDVAVSHQGQPFGGATVTVFARVDGSSEADAMRCVTNAEPSMSHDVVKPNDGLLRLCTDISDDEGRIRFAGLPGLHYVAVARVPGQLVGTISFVGRQGQAAGLELHPARTIEVVTEDRRQSYEKWQGQTTDHKWKGREFWLNAPGLSELETLALRQTSRNPVGVDGAPEKLRPNLFAFTPDGRPGLYWDDGRYLVEDLPINQHYQIQARPQIVTANIPNTPLPDLIVTQREVTLTADSPPIERITITAPATGTMASR